MSDYEVSLVEDSMQEFHVRFFGPAESGSCALDALMPPAYEALSTVRWRRVDDPR